MKGLRGQLNESESTPRGVPLDISRGVGGLSLAYGSVRTSQSCRLLICLARREPIVITCNCCRKTVQETPKFWWKLRHAVGSRGGKNKPRVRLQASTEQPDSERGEQEARTASSGAAPGPCLGVCARACAFQPVCEHLPKMHGCSVSAPQLCLLVASLVSSPLGR